MTPNDSHLTDAQSLLTAISGRILQVSDRRASAAMGAASKTIIATSAASAVMGAVGTFGTASTGAAIAGLAGAAKTTASLYWIGGIVGGGVAAGTLMVGAGALGVGIYGSIKVRRAILGHARSGTLSDREQTIVLAVHALVEGIKTAAVSGKPISNREAALFSRLGITPLVAEVESALSDGAFADLKMYNRARLRGHLINLRSLQARMEQA